MYTVTNQNTVVIHREMPESNFLQIKNENWQNMIKETQDYPAFILYMYLAANANNYTLALSPAAIKEATGLPKSTYYKKIKLLIEKGYIVEGKGNQLHFYEVPQKSKRKKIENKESGCGSLPHEQENLSDEHENLSQRTAPPAQKQNYSPQNIEIDNKYNTDKENIKYILELLEHEETQKPKEFVF